MSYIAMMPLRKNVPNPVHSDWRPVCCPVCGQECWRQEKNAERFTRIFADTQFLCTDGITASGLPVEEGVTCAVDPEVIPLFSVVYVEYADGTVERFRATDTGVIGNWVDIYTSDYDNAVRCGLQSLTVCWTAPEECLEQ